MSKFKASLVPNTKTKIMSCGTSTGFSSLDILLTSDNATTDADVVIYVSDNSSTPSTGDKVNKTKVLADYSVVISCMVIFPGEHVYVLSDVNDTHVRIAEIEHPSTAP